MASSSSSSSSKSQDVEKKMMNLKLKGEPEEKPLKSVTGVSSSLTPKDLMKMKSLKIDQEPDDEKEKEPLLGGSSDSDTDHYQSGGSCFVSGEGSSSASGEKKKSMVLLKSGEGDVFQVEESIAVLSQTLKHMIEDSYVAGNVIPLDNISTEILVKVLVFLDKHEDKERDEDEKQELIKWDEQFVKGIKDDKNTLFSMVLAADFLAAKCLMEVTCQAVADMVIDKSPDGIREYFNVKSDFTPEEEEEIRRENAWAFEE